MNEPTPRYWRAWYAALLLFLLAQIVLFSWITQKF